MSTFNNRIKKHLGKVSAMFLAIIMVVICSVGTSAYATTSSTPSTYNSSTSLDAVIVDDYGTLGAGGYKSGTFTLSSRSNVTIYYGAGPQANGYFEFGIISERDTVQCGDMKSTTITGIGPGTYSYSITNHADGAASYSFTVMTN